MNTITVEHCTIEEAFALSLQIPEFEPWYTWAKWQERLEGKKVIALCAFVDGIGSGFKVGYFEEEHFYSWVGGVVPAFRKMGIAGLLADVQEKTVRATDVSLIKMKTRNRFDGMLVFSIRRGFYISGVEQRGEAEDWRITLTKNL